MRKILIATFIAVFAMVSNVNAQVYYTYDGDAFNVYLGCDDNSIVRSVQFTDAAKTKWIKFTLVGQPTTYDDGFRYTVKDGQGKLFYVDYYDSDYITVTNVNTG
ncbi:MAG: hypothetical protein P1P88_08000, partial [Bacteroidales bacterium]|nr:hypothetical protein [Bacteroidales bacterium]